MCELINLDTLTWNEELIYKSFRSDEAASICAIPLSARMPEDKMIWGLEPKGKYTVKSAYHWAISLACESQHNRAASSTDVIGWKQIWGSGVLPRIKHFLWRACVNSLPSKDNLYHRKITRESTYGICGSEVESLVHVLFRCREVVDIWNAGPFHIDSTYLIFPSVKQIVWCLLDKLSHNKFNYVACLMCSIWNNRNKFYMEQKSF